jgi:Protocatechuate 3,4-dioxygenase beta subunit N terminal
MGTPAPFRRDDDAHPPLDWPDYRSTEPRAPHRPLRPLRHGATELTRPVLGELDADARATLIAATAGDGYRFDIRLQGSGETAFFVV